MAVIHTESQNVIIELENEVGDSVNWKIDNPIANLTLTQIRTALQAMFNGSNDSEFNIFCDSKGFALTNVKGASIESIVKNVEILT